MHSEWFKSSRVYQRIGPTIERLASVSAPGRFFWRASSTERAIRPPSSGHPSPALREICDDRSAGPDRVGQPAGFHWIRCTGWAMILIGKFERKHHSHLLLIAIAVSFAGVFLMRWYNRRGSISPRPGAARRRCRRRKRKFRRTPMAASRVPATRGGAGGARRLVAVALAGRRKKQKDTAGRRVFSFPFAMWRGLYFAVFSSMYLTTSPTVCSFSASSSGTSTENSSSKAMTSSTYRANQRRDPQ